MLVMDTVLWSRGKAAYGWTLVVLTVATWEIFPHDWMDGIARSSLLFTLPLFGAIMLYAAARTAVEDLKLFAYGAVTLAEVVSILPFDEFDFDIREHVSGFDYELRYVAPDGAVIETRMRRSKRIPGIEDEALEPLLHLPGVGNEEILMVDEMGSIRVRRDGGLTLRSFRSVVPLAMVAFNVWWGVAHLV